MGKSKKLKYHIFSYSDYIVLVLVEPKNNNFIWIYFYLEPELRNSILSTQFVLYVIYRLKGIHHIHWQRRLKTFKTLVLRYNWITRYKSTIFQDCNYSVCSELQDCPILYRMFNRSIHHKITLRRPKELAYQDESEVQKVLTIIRKQVFD
jgi:hypothetical protein